MAWPVQIGVLPREADGFQQRAAARALDTAPRGGTHALTGMGGVGKTQIAARHARNAWRAGRLDLLVWVTATSRQAVLDAFAEAAETVLNAERDRPERAARAFLAWLEPKGAADGPRWLVVLDDVTDPADLTGLWPPDSPAGRTLVTTRARDAALTGRGHRALPVDVFTREESAAYLTAALAAHDREPPEELTALARELGGLPLALSQATAYIIDTATTCAGYRARLTDRARRLADLRPAALPDDQTDGTAAAWSLSLERADRSAPAGAARPLLRLAAMLDPHGIPEAVLTSAPARAWAARQAGVPVPPEAAVGVLRTLHRMSLLDHTPRVPHRAVRVHRLVQRAVRDTLPVPEQDALARVAADALLAAWPDGWRGLPEDDAPAGLAAGDVRLAWGAGPPDPALAEALEANAAALLAVAGDALYAPALHDLLFRAARSRGEASVTTEALLALVRLLDEAERHLGPDHPDVARARRHLTAWREFRRRARC